MYRDEEVRLVVEELIRVTHHQTRCIEMLIEHLAQTVGKPPELQELAILGSEMSALQVRARELVEQARTEF